MVSPPSLIRCVAVGEPASTSFPSYSNSRRVMEYVDGNERRFGAEDLFFSTTDTKGVIRRTNLDLSLVG